ncbi:hypothetical protein VV02_24555 [Luteipulveratus mongoliensis]|uniref:Fe/B12 periplasmic-binding domain-containing protein n=1 Tax=Luteipulveratus mongoliensis TaxID=571913 RepID=A0A0K1JRD9_9MICO|nr:hypothetical protein VV02_24555 [Luteipulveratus mongoliensis]
MPTDSAAVSRRAFTLGAAGLAAGLLAACSDSADSAESPSGAGKGAGSGEWKPVRVKHKFGETTVAKRPVRIVSAGYTEHDFLLALGITPIAVTDWYGDQPYATWPWAQAKLGGAKPTVLKLDDGFQFVEIAKLKPDLIIACNAGLEQPAYTKLSKIAPTIAQTGKGTDFFEPWTHMMELIGASVGMPAEAKKIREGVAATFAAAAKAHPELAKKKAIFLQNAVSDGNLIAYQDGLSTEFLTDLGLVVPDAINSYIKEGEQAYIPVEKISVLNAADILVWGTEKDADRTALEKVPGFQNLTAVKNKRSVYTGGELAGAIYFSSPLSLPYVVDKLVPMLAAVAK